MEFGIEKCAMLIIKVVKGCDPIYPTPPFEQDMTQGQFLSEV